MDLERLESGHRVEMYVSPACPNCEQASAHFEARGHAYIAYDAQNDRAQRGKMFAYTGGDVSTL
jgi:glutaredoxin